MKNLTWTQTELHQDMSLYWLQHSQFCSFSHHSAIRSKFQNNNVHCSSEIPCNPGFTYGDTPHDLLLLKIHYIRGHSQHSRWTTMMIPLSFFFFVQFCFKKTSWFWPLKSPSLGAANHSNSQEVSNNFDSPLAPNLQRTLGKFLPELANRTWHSFESRHYLIDWLSSHHISKLNI